MNSKDIDKAYSIKELKTLLSLEIQQIFESPDWSEKRFRLTSLDFSDTRKSLLFLSIFTKIVTNDNLQFQIKINKILSENASEKYFSEFIILLSGVDKSSTSLDTEWIEAFENLLKVVDQLLLKIPTAALSSLGLCTFLESLIASLIIASNNKNENKCLESIQNNVRDLRRCISERLVRPEIEKRKETLEKRKPPNDFRKISILPTREDIFHEPFLRKNLKSGSYQNLDDYLDVQFRLLREDCIAQLRSGIYEFIEANKVLAGREIKRLQDVKLYKNVVVVSKEASLSGPLFGLQLDYQQISRINWERSKRLLYGSLLCLSPDDFDTLYFAVVEKADHIAIRQNGMISVCMKKEKGQPDINIGSRMTMVESTAYFESYRHVLCCLQAMTEEDMPFKRYIVQGCNNTRLPKYLERHDYIEFDFGPILEKDFIFKPFQRIKKENLCQICSDQWPSANDLHVDESQYKALKFALTNEFVIIQGPPGTGKTHIGLQIAKALLHNKHYWVNDIQINDYVSFRERYEGDKTLQDTDSYAMLIVCYTNHALDQFIEGILNFLSPMNERSWSKLLVRVGSRCTNPRIETFSLIQKRKYVSHLHSRHGELKKMLEKSYKRLQN